VTRPHSREKPERAHLFIRFVKNDILKIIRPLV
jgi:hypothetical protein